MVIATLDPIVKSQIDIRLFKNVKNVPDLRKKVMSGELQCCLVNPKFILDSFQLIIAANKALTTENKTKSVFTEILFNLSVSKNITKSLQQFGINDDCMHFLVVTVNSDAVDVNSEINGDEADLKVLEELRDLKAIRRVYKIKPEEEKNTSLLDSVVSRIATKDFISH